MKTTFEEGEFDDEDSELDKMTPQPENNKENKYKAEYILDHIARLYQGTSKCAAVALTDEGQLLVSRNDIFQTLKQSNEPTRATTHFNAINILLFCISKGDPLIDNCLEIAMENLIKNYECEKHSTLNVIQKKAISLEILKKDKLSTNILISKDDLAIYLTKTQKCEAASLFVAGNEFMRTINQIRMVLEEEQTDDTIIKRVKNAILTENIILLKHEAENLHAETRIMSFFLTKNMSKFGYIGISKLPCLSCSNIIKMFNLVGHDVQTRSNLGHGIHFDNWIFPSFFSQQKEILSKQIFSVMIKNLEDIDKLKAALDGLTEDFSFKFLREELIYQLNSNFNLQINSRAGKPTIKTNIQKIMTENLPENIKELHLKLKQISDSWLKETSKNDENLPKIQFKENEGNIFEKKYEKKPRVPMSAEITSDKNDNAVKEDFIFLHELSTVFWIDESESEREDRIILTNVAIQKPEIFQKIISQNNILIKNFEKETNKELGIMINFDAKTVYNCLLKEKSIEIVRRFLDSKEFKKNLNVIKQKEKLPMEEK